MPVHHLTQILATGGALSDQDFADVAAAFRSLIDAENAKDTVSVDRLIWDSPSTLLVDKLENVKQRDC
jgi:hypothetical protein